jgi:hypothetical protein
MTTRHALAGLILAGVAASGATIASCPSGSLVQQQYVVRAGYVEPHTPGSGVGGVEMPATLAVQKIVGAAPNLNRVSYVRTYQPKPSGAPPRVILILIPGFISGAGPFTPLAKQLVTAFNGNLEVWAVDRRPNQLEDVRGTNYAAAHFAVGDTNGVLDALQFLFPDVDPPGPEPFPTGPGDVDVDGDGVVDPPFALPDALGGSSPFVKLAQNDVRFAAYWGVDTYVRDWKILVDEARSIVGPQGLVLFGGHSMGTGWATAFAAYDFDPSSGVDPGYAKIDGLLLLEGGGLGTGTGPTLASYQQSIADLAATDGPDVFLSSFSGADLALLGASSGIAGLDGVNRPGQHALLQRTSFAQTFPLNVLFGAPAASETIVGLFLDDDMSPASMLAGSFGFSDDGPNTLIPAGAFPGASEFYLAGDDGNPQTLRQWKNYSDPTLPSCPPNVANVSPGCALMNHGPRPLPTDPPAHWGDEKEVSDIYEAMRILSAPGNFLEWYFVSGRVFLDFSYGRDSSSLGDESLLAITQTANVNVPILAIGGSNGLTPTEASYASLFGAVATPPADEEIFLAEGYAHLDVVTAAHNVAVPPIVDWMNRLLQRKLLAGF